MWMIPKPTWKSKSGAWSLWPLTYAPNGPCYAFSGGFGSILLSPSKSQGANNFQLYTPDIHILWPQAQAGGRRAWPGGGARGQGKLIQHQGCSLTHNLKHHHTTKTAQTNFVVSHCLKNKSNPSKCHRQSFNLFTNWQSFNLFYHLSII